MVSKSPTVPRGHVCSRFTNGERRCHARTDRSRSTMATRGSPAASASSVAAITSCTAETVRAWASSGWFVGRVRIRASKRVSHADSAARAAPPGVDVEITRVEEATWGRASVRVVVMARAPVRGYEADAGCPEIRRPVTSPAPPPCATGKTPAGANRGSSGKQGGLAVQRIALCGGPGEDPIKKPGLKQAGRGVRETNDAGGAERLRTAAGSRPGRGPRSRCRPRSSACG